MKKNTLTYVILLPLLALPAIGHAQTPTMPSIPIPLPTGIRQRLETNFQNRVHNVQSNGEYRNGLLEGRMQATGHEGEATTSEMNAVPPQQDIDHAFMASSTMNPRPMYSSSTMDRNNPERSFIRHGRRMKNDIANASTTERTASTTDIENQPREKIATSTTPEEFSTLKNSVVQQMETALNNLRQIRTRIDSRIEKEKAAGIDVTSASQLLDTADTDITQASSSIDALISFEPEASTTIDIVPARTLGQTAIASITTARNALNDVVSALMKTSDTQ